MILTLIQWLCMDETFLIVLKQLFTKQASERDFRTILAKDATSVIYDIALQELKNIGVSLIDTDECIVWIGGTSSKIQNIL